MTGNKPSYIPNGELARTLREREGWSQDELGERAACGVRTIRNIEKGIAVSAETLKSVAPKLGLAHWHDLLADAEKQRLGMRASGRTTQVLSHEAGNLPNMHVPDHAAVDGCHLIVDELLTWLLRREVVNLVVEERADWRTLTGEVIRRLQDATGETVGMVDLNDPLTSTRRGLLDQLLRSLGLADGLPDKPYDLVEFGKRLKARTAATVVLTHFDHVAIPERRAEYGVDLFNTLRWYTMDERKLTLCLVSRQPLGRLLPGDHPLSELNAKLVEFRASS